MKKLSIVFLLLLVFLLLGFVVNKGMGVNLNQGYEPTQPIAFSHKVHAGINKIPCQYCHFAADKGRHAGIPPTELCMNCHTMVKTESPEIAKINQAMESGKSIKWVKVHYLPDFVYFNHSQHVRVGKFACQTCHGPIETMDVVKQFSPLSMGWCVNCHRDNGIAPPADHKRAAGGDCSKCHY